jgi:UDP-glucose:(heptosyl)LPS alpha-1,3-glucosyltransferase
MRTIKYDISIGFNKTYGQDILYPQGGLHVACVDHNLLKYDKSYTRFVAKFFKLIDLTYWSYFYLEKKQYCSSMNSYIIVNSNMVRKHFEIYYGISSDRIRVIPSAIDTDRFTADDRLKQRYEERTHLGIPPHAVVGLFIAMNYRLKGLSPLLKAFAKTTYPLLYLVVVGHPSYGRYQRLASRYGIADRVIFLGHRPDPRNCYFAADFLVHPTFYDPCSLVVLEALTCGLPVITSRYNGAAELLHPPAEGLVIDDPHNTDALAAALLRMCDSGYRRDAAVAARQLGEYWSFERHYQSLLDVFREIRRSKLAA